MFPMGKHTLPMSRQQIDANLHPILLEDPFRGACTFIRANAVDSFRGLGLVTHVFLVLGFFTGRKTTLDSTTVINHWDHHWKQFHFDLAKKHVQSRRKSWKSRLKHRQSMLTGPKSTGTANICKHSLQQIVISCYLYTRWTGQMPPWLRGMLPHLRWAHQYNTKTCNIHCHPESHSCKAWYQVAAE